MAFVVLSMAYCTAGKVNRRCAGVKECRSADRRLGLIVTINPNPSQDAADVLNSQRSGSMEVGGEFRSSSLLCCVFDLPGLRWMLCVDINAVHGHVAKSIVATVTCDECIRLCHSLC